MIDHSTWPVPNSAASSNCLTFLSGVHRNNRVPSGPIMADTCAVFNHLCHRVCTEVIDPPGWSSTLASVDSDLLPPDHQDSSPTETTMALGPIEVLVISFPGNQFSGGIIPELERLVDNDTISIIDGVLVQKDADGEVTFTEFEELGGNADAAKLANVMDQLESLISDDDVMELAEALEPNCSEAILVFEHTWAKPLRNAIIDSGGVLENEFRVPGLVVEELLTELAELGD